LSSMFSDSHVIEHKRKKVECVIKSDHQIIVLSLDRYFSIHSA